MGKDGQDCWNTCPMKCGPEELHCGGGIDPWTGCNASEWCMPAKGPVGNDGTACPQSCPVKCGIEDVRCAGGQDANGCWMPESCHPQGTQCPAV